MDRESIRTLKDKVEVILEHIPETRNNDKLLTIKLWREFFPSIIKEGVKVFLEDILELPSQDGIKRVRAHIQNKEKRLIPTELKIAQARGWLEDEWKSALGYKVEATGQGVLF